MLPANVVNILEWYLVRVNLIINEARWFEAHWFQMMYYATPISHYQ